MWNPPIWIYSEEHFLKLPFRYSPVHQWQWKKVEESEEVKGTVKHHCGPLEPHHITWLPGFVAQTKLHRGQLRTDEIAFARTLYMQLYTPLPLQSSLSHIHKVKVQSLRFILHTDERRGATIARPTRGAPEAEACPSITESTHFNVHAMAGWTSEDVST